MQLPVKKGLLLTALALTTLGVAVGPAGAVAVPPETGAGVTPTGGFNNYSTTDFSILPPFPLCLGNSSPAILTLNNTGTFSAGPGNLFVGDTQATVTIPAGTLYFNPAGTFSDPMCTVPAFGPTGIPAGLTVTKVSGTGTVSCSGNARYGREGENGLVVSTDATCTVNGVATSPTLLQFTGLQQPCFPNGPPPVDPCAPPGTEWAGAYTEN